MKHFLLATIAIVLLMAPLAAASVKVESPNGGETWALGTPQNITWTSKNAGSIKVDIILRRGNTKFGVIKSQVLLSDGSWPWTSVVTLEDGTPIPPGTNYIVRIRDAGDTFRDDSDAFFSISDASPPPPPPPGGDPTLMLTSPNGGESWPIDGTRNITWNVANFTGAVDLILKKFNEKTQKDEMVGIIATKLPATQGAYPWTVGTLLLGKTAGIGEGYKVRLVKNYEGLFMPKGKPMLADESDNVFSIKRSLSVPIPEAMKMNVSAPAEGSIFEYGQFAVNDARNVKVKCRWTTAATGPFEFFLREVANMTEMPLQPVKGPAALGNNTYEAEFKLTTKFTSPGPWYKIHVKSALARGYSGKFQLKYKLIDVMLTPAYHDKYYYSYKYYNNQEFTASKALLKEFPSKPKNARVGFHNQYFTWPNGEWSYTGFLFRSRIVFDLSRFAKLKGSFKEAKLIVQQNEFHHTPGIDLADCLVSVYVLAEPWSGGGGDAFFAIPGNLIQQFPNSTPNNFDIPEWAAAWAKGTSPNYGLLFVGGMEKMNHDNLFHISYYQIFLKIQFQEE